jgi:hypothetical protein
LFFPFFVSTIAKFSDLISTPVNSSEGEVIMPPKRNSKIKGSVVAEHSRSLATANEVAKYLTKSKDAKRNRKAAHTFIQALFHPFVEVSINSIDGCAYSDDMGGWIQADDVSSLTVHFSVKNMSPRAYSGKVEAYLDASLLLSWGSETDIVNLSPGASASGRIWFYARRGSSQPSTLKITFSVPRASDGTLNINPKTGQPGGGTFPDLAIATASYPYVFGSRSEINAAMISVLGIVPVYDDGGRLKSASAVDRFGVFRQVQFSTYEDIRHKSPGDTLPYNTRMTFSGYMTYSERILDGKQHIYDTAQRAIPDRLVPGRVLSVGFAIGFDDAGSDLLQFHAFIVGFPLGSEVKRDGDSAPSNVVGLSGPVTGHIAPRGNVVVDEIVRLDGSLNNKTVHGDYIFYSGNPLGGVYKGFDPNVETLFSTELRRFGYFAPLLNEDLILKEVWDAQGGSYPPTATSAKKTALPSRAEVTKLRSQLPKNQFSDIPFKFYDGVIVGDPANTDQSILPNRNEWIAIAMAATCAAVIRYSCFAGPVSCGIGIVGGALCAHIVRRVNNTPVNSPVHLPNPNLAPIYNPPAPRSSPTAPDNPPINPPLQNPGPPGGVGSMTCDFGYIEVNGVCVPVTPVPGDIDTYP